jgi:MFS transporter, FHS family, L-fucose permease
MTEHIFRKHKLALVLTFGLFALWGMGHRLYDTLVPEFAKAFELGSVELVVTQNIYSFVYLLLAIPAALYARTFGSKAGIVFGLGAWCVGAFMFYPAAQQHAYLFFLFAAAVISCGYIFIEIAVNPIVARMGPPETAIRRLNFAHALYPVGVLAGVYVGRWLILSDLELPLEKLADAVVRPYMVIGVAVLALAFLVDKTDFPALATERGRGPGAMQEFRTLLSRPMFVAAIAAQCCGVAARAGTWVLSGTYIQAAIPGTSMLVAADFLLASLVIYGIGRFAGTALMFWINPCRLLAIFAGSGLVLAGVATVYGGEIGVYAMVASGFSMSITYATILGIAIRDLGPLTKAGTALIYTGGAGAAIGVMLMHVVWTFASIQYAMLVPMFGYAGVLAFAIISHKADAASRASAIAHAAE